VDSPLFVLTSDLGNGSPAVAQLKAVILAAAPSARLFDLSHDIPPQSIRYAELALRNTAFLFPAGTIHVVVVDPDVGTDRRAIAVAAKGHLFVGPDNGVLGVAIAQGGAEVVTLDRHELWRHPVAPTFHGRDVFAPIAATLATGRPLSGVGTPITNAKPSGLPPPTFKDERTVLGETLGADRFGNLMTNIPSHIGPAGEQELAESWLFEIEGQTVPFRRTYMAAKQGRLIVTQGADRFLEVAVARGSAKERIGAEMGTKIQCIKAR